MNAGFWRGMAAGALALTVLLGGGAPGVLAADSGTLQQDKQEAQQLKDDLDGLDRQLKAAIEKQRAIEAEIAAAMEKSAGLRTEITDTVRKMEEQRDKLKGRVRIMYEAGDASFWEVLFGATNFSDFIDRFTALTMVMEQDRKLIDEYQANQKKLQASLDQLEAEQQNRKQKQAELIAVQTELDTKYKDQMAVWQAKQSEIAAEEAVVLADAQQAYQSSQSSSSADTPAFITGGGGGAYAWPVPSSHAITSGYGYRGSEFHKGIDIGAPVGTPIIAIADGTVVQSGPASGYGHWIVVSHDDGMTSIYGHMYANGLKVGTGQRVQRGQVIALVGNDGRSTGAHLHLSITQGSAYVNPMGYLQ